MGVNKLWTIIGDFGAHRSSLRHFINSESIDRLEGGRRPLIVGVDAEQWMYSADASIHRIVTSRGASMASIGKNAPMKLIFKRLAELAKLAASFVFIFDGGSRPEKKRGRQVRMTEHWMVMDFKRALKAWGFAYYTAPGEGEAELALQNRLGNLDIVWTNDSDVFVFGAVNVMRSESSSADEDSIQIYTPSTLIDRDGNKFGTPEFLLLALLLGGDYGDGLNLCGTATATQLCANSRLPQDLFNIVTEQPRHSVRAECRAWSNQLAGILRNNPNGILRRSAPSLASNISASFPKLEIIKKYTDPITSANTGPRPNIHAWKNLTLPNSEALASFSWELFNVRDLVAWGRKRIWPALCLRQLVQVDAARTIALEDGLGTDAILRIVSVSRRLSHPSSYMEYKVEMDISSQVSRVAWGDTDQQSGSLLQPVPPTRQHTDHRLQVWIPAPILKRVAPEQVKSFHRKHGPPVTPKEDYEPFLQFYFPPTTTGIIFESSSSSSPSDLEDY